MMRSRTAISVLLPAVMAGVLLGALATAAAAQGAVTDLHLRRQPEGEPLEPLPSPPGEKHFHLEEGVDTFYIAFDFEGTSETEVQIRVLGPMGVVLFQEFENYAEPGTKVVEFSTNSPLESNEYVVNTYVTNAGQLYLADSLQLAVGEAEIPGSREESMPAESDQADQAVEAPVQPAATSAETASEVAGGPSAMTLAFAGLGVLALLAIVLWAGRSAMRAG